jgi:hypothetical protein
MNQGNTITIRPGLVELQRSDDVTDLEARIKRITTSDDGKLQVLIECEYIDERGIEKVKTMLGLQRTEGVLVSMKVRQMDMFDQAGNL